MWREDDFEDKGRQIKSVPTNKRGEVITTAPAGPAERVERTAQESSA